MKTIEKLEPFWQFRLAKILWVFAVIVIWIYGSIGIWLYFSHNPYQAYLQYHTPRSFLWELYDFDDFSDKGHMRMLYAQNYGEISEKSSQFEFWKYPKMILAFFILTGSLVLATILAYRILLYILYGKNFSKNNGENPQQKQEDENKEDNNKVEDNNDKNEVIEAEIVEEKTANAK